MSIFAELYSSCATPVMVLACTGNGMFSEPFQASFRVTNKIEL